jgi:hypothetical protein
VRGGRGSHAALAAIAVLACSRLAQADSVLVILAGPAGSADAPNERMNRIRGELLADGFRVRPTSPVRELDRVATLRGAAQAMGGPITAALFVDEEAGIDIYLLDALSDRLVVRHLDTNAAPPDGGPEVVARHAVDLLRASILDFAIEGLRSAAATAPSTTSSPPHGETLERPAAARWALEAGLGVLGSFEGVGAAVVPAARLRFAASRTFQIRLTGAGFGSTPTVETDRGTAAVQQGVAIVDGAAVLGHARWLRPTVALGAGAYYASVTGSGVAPPYRGQTGRALAVAFDGALGLATSVMSNVELSLEAHAVVTEPGIAVRFIDVDAARLGRPSLLVTFTVAGWI